MRGDVFHPRLPAERNVEAGVRRIGRAVHEQQRALRRVFREIGRALVADEDFDAGLGRHHHVFGDELGHECSPIVRHGRHSSRYVMAGLVRHPCGRATAVHVVCLMKHRRGCRDSPGMSVERLECVKEHLAVLHDLRLERQPCPGRSGAVMVPLYLTGSTHKSSDNPMSSIQAPFGIEARSCTFSSGKDAAPSAGPRCRPAPKSCAGRCSRRASDRAAGSGFSDSRRTAAGRSG